MHQIDRNSQIQFRHSPFGNTAHKITFPEYKGRFSVYCNQEGLIDFAEQKLNGGAIVREVNKERHSILWKRLQNKMNYLAEIHYQNR